MAEGKTFSFLVEGGKATGGPPIGPALGPLGMNVMAVVKRINELTASFAGMKVPVKVHVDLETKKFEVEVGIPSVSALLAREAGIEKGVSQAGREYAADLKFDQIVKIAKIKVGHTNSIDLKGVIKEALGTCMSMGISVEGKSPKTITKEIDEGAWDSTMMDQEAAG